MRNSITNFRRYGEFQDYENIYETSGNNSSPDDEIEELKKQAQALELQLIMISEQIRYIEQGEVDIQRLPVVNPELCTACSMCSDACPQAAIHIDELAVIDRSKCNGCGICVAECPENAISIKGIK
jgi:heterodisulfide reductase subunit A-like polyferredoxin